MDAPLTKDQLNTLANDTIKGTVHEDKMIQFKQHRKIVVDPEDKKIEEFNGNSDLWKDTLTD